MSDDSKPQAQLELDELYRTESRRVLATLIRLLGDFELAEDALQDAFAAALRQWPAQGIPDNPRAWLISTGRFKAIDRLRRRDRHQSVVSELEAAPRPEAPTKSPWTDTEEQDDRLRLIFTCCHPALSREARVALTLREVCGLTTDEIARAFLVKPATLAQRIVRAKQKIRAAAIPYEIPPKDELPQRLESVLQVLYLVFNEGYSASAGDSLTRRSLSEEAIFLGRMLASLLPAAETQGLLAMMLLHESRRTSRCTPDGDIILLSEQDRSKWDRGLIKEGIALVEEALQADSVGPYALQAAISAVHAEAPDFESTDWAQIVALYDLLLGAMPSPVVELNRGVAVAMHQGPDSGLVIIDELLERGELDDYHLIHAARADLCRRLGRVDDARRAYQQALEFTQQGPERRFLHRRLEELEGQESDS
jgi:RNA polymerase sigma-70 factor, ECF subfamily